MSDQPREWTVLSMLKWATDYFEEHNVPGPRMSIEWLLAHVLEIKRLDLYLKYDRPLASHELDALRPLVKRRARHEPLQYITGSTDFMNAEIQVEPGVLIPRIETEHLVEIVLDDHPATEFPVRQVLDIGTGSGCIPVALKMERPGWSLTGVDISQDALRIARLNAGHNEVEIALQRADIRQWKQEQPGSGPSFDIVISNPPYILPEERDSLEAQVRDYEPEQALFCDDLPALYGDIIAFCEARLKPQGLLYLECHELHTGEILGLFNPDRWEARVLHDYGQKERFISARLRA